MEHRGIMRHAQSKLLVLKKKNGSSIPYCKDKRLHLLQVDTRLYNMRKTNSSLKLRAFHAGIFLATVSDSKFCKNKLHVVLSVLFHSFCDLWGGWDPVNRFNYTSWMADVAPTDRHKSVRNRCVIDVIEFLCCHFAFWNFLLM